MVLNPDDEFFEALEARMAGGRAERRFRKSPNNRSSHNSQSEPAPLADELDAAAGSAMTYQPGPFETGWLEQSLQPLFDQGLIIDVLAIIKGGKEANVYRCEAHPATGLHHVAAKVYRPRMFRNLRNDADYREGRTVIKASGKAMKDNEQRVLRALAKKSKYGQQVSHISWLMHEYVALQRLYEAGATVPQPLGVSENGILMSLIGDEYEVAPPLASIVLDSDEAEAAFRSVILDVDRMLAAGVVHGDLSAYNILYWRGRATIIDFPQVSSLASNSHAREFLQRDIGRIVEYFSAQGVTDTEGLLCDTDWLMSALEQRHFPRYARDRGADWSRFSE